MGEEASGLRGQEAEGRPVHPDEGRWPWRGRDDLDRHFRITETILKGMVVRAEEPRRTRFKSKPSRSHGEVGTATQEVGDGELQ